MTRLRSPFASLCALALVPACNMRAAPEGNDGGVDPVDAPVLVSDAPLAPPDTRPVGSDARIDAPRDASTGTCGAVDLGTATGRPVVTGETSTATATYTAECGYPEASPARFYRWTAPADGTYAVETFGSDFDTALVVLDGGCEGPQLDCNDDAGGPDGYQSRVDLTVSAGDVVVIVVTGYDAVSAGAFVLGISQPELTHEIGLCDNGLDDDVDGSPDCLDYDDCALDPACIEADCGNGLDDDGDGYADCEDYEDCGSDPACVETICDDMLDNDGDGALDCADYDCDGTASCVETVCDDGRDDEGDGVADCEDRDCEGAPNCVERCATGIDEDFDGLIDCQDGDCDADAACAGLEHCTNGIDDDGDGTIDCDDNDCITHPWCEVVPL